MEMPPGAGAPGGNRRAPRALLGMWERAERAMRLEAKGLFGVSAPEGPALVEPALAALRAYAGPEDRGERSIEGSVDALRAAGLLAPRPPEPGLLVRIAEANLSAARLYEGHVNALRLIEVHGTAAQYARAAREAAGGALLGVWGADGARPVRHGEGGLTGAKRFASGLGSVSKAVVSVDGGPEMRLALVDVTDGARQRPEEWDMLGMRATASGGYEFEGVAEVEWIGGPGVYMTEPWFIGGVWRIAAIQLGGALGLLRAAADHLERLERLGAEAQLSRLGAVLARAMGARGLVERAAEVAEGPEGLADPERAVALSGMARLETEETGQAAIAAVERSVGLPHFDAGAETGRIARDLATYMRQAGRDALLVRAAAHAFGRPGPLSELWDG